jgi:hypothetical protein
VALVLQVVVAAGASAAAVELGVLVGFGQLGARGAVWFVFEREPLPAEGWRLRHSLPWPGRGDIDSIAIAPAQTGLAFTIETKTRRYTAEHLGLAREMAGWLQTRRRRWCRRGALPVLCIVNAHGVERIETVREELARRRGHGGGCLVESVGVEVHAADRCTPPSASRNPP